MRDLRRNSINVLAFKYKGLGDYIIDSHGHKTPNREVIYSDGEQYLLPVSSGSGQVNVQFYGSASNYSLVITTAQDVPFDEHTIFYIDENMLNKCCFDCKCSEENIDGNDPNTDIDGNLVFPNYDGGTFTEQKKITYADANYMVAGIGKYLNQKTYALRKR